MWEYWTKLNIYNQATIDRAITGLLDKQSILSTKTGVMDHIENHKEMLWPH